MGERHSGDGLPGRRHVHPGGLVVGPVPADGDAEFEAGLAAVLRLDAVDPEAEERAVAAFRTARDSGAHRTRTRRRDDWRPRQERRARLSLRATLSVLLASLTLGGVAFAAIGSAGSEGHDAGGDRRPAHPSASAPGQPAANPAAPASVTPSVRPDHPATAQDTLAHCRAYEQVKDHGKALDATAWQRLVTAAGGEQNIAAYCAAQLARTNGPDADKTNKPHNSGSNGGSGTGGSGTGSSTDNSGNSGSNGGSGTGSSTGNGGNSGSNGDTGTGSSTDNSGSNGGSGTGSGTGNGGNNGGSGTGSGTGNGG
ncbi:hypothetical protein, partial [Streptomyces sp. NPDC007905]|uniref:hypothetical protein n=1 Tax=Streptomyces sp. NPDC007905 TaxID=3364788 RepID=UPI0036EDD662